MRAIRRIVMHCAATPEGGHYTAADIDRWHRARGWRGIGYHAVVSLDGTIEPGRPEAEAGAHAVGHNDDTLAICYIGGVAEDGRTPRDTRTEAQRDALREQVQHWRQHYGIPIEQVLGHRELDPRKACPCFDVDAFRAELRADLTAADDDEARPRALPSDLPVVRAIAGDTSRSARYLQKVLNARGADITVDGILGPQTYQAIADVLAPPPPRFELINEPEAIIRGPGTLYFDHPERPSSERLVVVQGVPEGMRAAIHLESMGG